MRSLVQLLERAARERGSGLAVDDGEQRVSFEALAGRVARLAAGLEARGVGSGARVAVLSRNRVEYVELYLAVSALGAALVPVSWRLHPREIAFVLEDSGARIVIAEADFLAACPARADLERVLLAEPRAGLASFAELYAAGPGIDLAARAPDPDGAAVQMYTSGTTGRPKGATLSSRALLALLDPWLAETGLCEEDRFLQVTPLFHVGGMLLALSCLAARATLRLLPEFLPRPALDVLERERITATLLVPMMVRWIVDEARRGRPEISDLRLVIYGAAPMPVPLLEEAMKLLGCDFLQGYGLTETCGVVSVLRPQDHRYAPGSPPPARLGSAGRAISCCELRVVDPAGREVPAGEVGEVVVRGANLMLGYWRRPEADAEAVREGWLWTGDLGRLDAEGFQHLVDRRNDMICVAGQNVFPGEVESALVAHPEVADAAVIGVPHATWGEEVLALVVPRAGAERDPQLARVLVQHCRGELARYKCPTRVELCDALPRNAAGKLARRELREPYWVGHERRIS